MSTHNTCICEEIRKISMFRLKKAMSYDFDLRTVLIELAYLFPYFVFSN